MLGLPQLKMCSTRQHLFTIEHFSASQTRALPLRPESAGEPATRQRKAHQSNAHERLATMRAQSLDRSQSTFPTATVLNLNRLPTDDLNQQSKYRQGAAVRSRSGAE
jgi:hypothetical protein